ncbi:hypothetical protein D9M70_504930 [compost metagenome]
MTGLDQILVFHRGAGNPVVVVGDVDFPLAGQGPVVAVRGAVEHVLVVDGAQSVRGRARCVVGEQRCAAHAALAGVVAPGLAGLRDLVEGLADQRGIAGQACRALGHRLVVEQGVVQARIVATLLVVAGEHFVLRGDRGEAAIALHRRLRRTAHDEGAAVAGDVVPQRLDATLRDRERNTAEGIDEAIAAFHQRGAGGVFEDVVVDPLWRRAGAARRVDRHLEAVRVGIEQGDLPGGELVLVLVQVGLGDGEQRLVGGVRVAAVLAGFVAGRCLGDATGPGGDGAGDVAGLFRT